MAQAENRNPGKRGNASGADRKTSCAQDTARATGAQSMTGEATGEGFKSKLWSRNALDVIRASRKTAPAAERMTFLCAAVAMDWMIFADRDGLLFRSAEDTAQAIGAAESNVREAASQLLRAGLAEIPPGLKKQTGKKTKGRDATTYRLLFVDISRLYGGGKSEAISACIGAENGEAISAPIGVGISAPIGVAIGGRTGKGAGARVNAPPAPIPSPSVVLPSEPETDAAHIVGGALERAPAVSEAELMAELSLVPDHLTDADAGDMVQDGEPVTLADLDRIEAEERAAVVALAFPPSDPEADPVAEAADDWAALHGAALDDAEGFALDVLDGFPDGDPDAATRAATTGARLLMACGSSRAAVPIWAEHREIMRRLFCATTASHARAEAALSAYHVAVGAVGKAARRTKAPRPAAANSETVTFGAAADV